MIHGGGAHLCPGATEPNPKSTSASRNLRAFVGSTNTSRSSVSRGSPWPATACPPIRRSRTRREISALKNSVQSRFSSIFTEPDPPQPFDARDPLLERHRRDVLAIDLVRLLEALGRADDALDHDGQYAAGRARRQEPSPRGISPPVDRGRAGSRRASATRPRPSAAARSPSRSRSATSGMCCSGSSSAVVPGIRTSGGARPLRPAPWSRWAARVALGGSPAPSTPAASTGQASRRPAAISSR